MLAKYQLLLTFRLYKIKELVTDNAATYTCNNKFSTLFEYEPLGLYVSPPLPPLGFAGLSPHSQKSSCLCQRLDPLSICVDRDIVI